MLFEINRKKAFGLIFLLLIIIYLPSLLAHKHVDPDAHTILLNLRSIGSINEYLEALFSFKTIDFQPIRDFSLSIDDYIFRHFGINTFIFQNLLLWSLAGTFFFGLIKALNPRRGSNFQLLALIWFSVYPLFSSTLPWGMARKHILATLFALALIERFIGSSRNKKDWVWIIGFYVLSLLSQPIDLLLPVWMSLFLWTSKTYRKSDLWAFVILFMLMIFSVSINLAYYEYSPIYRLIFPSKSVTLFSFADQLLALGHYAWTTFFPYQQAFMYSLSNISTLLGLLLIVIAGFAIYYTRAKESLVWCTLGIFALMPVISNPAIIQDTYLLLPSISFFIALTFKLEDISKRTLAVFMAVGLFWAGFSFHRNEIWLDISAFVENGFENDPNCDSATRVLLTNYNYGHQENPNAMAFLKQNQCFLLPASTPQTLSDRRQIQSRALLNDKTMPSQEKKQLFIKSEESGNIFALIALVTFSIEENSPDTEIYLSKLTDASKLIRIPHYDILIRDNILPYCKVKGVHECTQALERFGRKADSPWI